MFVHARKYWIRFVGVDRFYSAFSGEIKPRVIAERHGDDPIGKALINHNMSSSCTSGLSLPREGHQ
jgi:hypothetical protein